MTGQGCLIACMGACTCGGGAAFPLNLAKANLIALTATTMTPWTLVSIWLTLAIVPGVDDPLTRSAKT